MSNTENSTQPISERLKSYFSSGKSDIDPSEITNDLTPHQHNNNSNWVTYLVIASIIIIAFIFYRKNFSQDFNLFIFGSLILTTLICILIYFKQKRVENTNNLTSEQTETIKSPEQPFKMLIHYTPAAVAMFDNDMRYIMTSERWISDYGLESQTIIGQSHYEVLRDVFNTSEWKEIYQRALQGEVIFKEEDSYLLKNGTIEWSKWAIHPWRGVDNAIGGVIMFREDITERKRAEQALQDREAHLSSIINNIVDGIITINEYGIVESFNPACERIFGYTSEDVIGKNITQLILESYHSVHDTYLNNFRMAGSNTSENSVLELEGKRKDGSSFSLELSINLVHLANRRIFCAIVRDITQRKEAERAKNEFISTVSQELSSPLNSIRSAVALILDTMMEEIPAKIQPILKTVLSNCERLVTTVNEILDVDKVTSGKLAFSMREENLALLVQKSIENNLIYEEKYGIRFELGVLPTTMIVNVDAARILQVMDNLLSNAAKFSEKGKSVEISVYHVEGRYGVSVKDHGAGIPKEFKPNIFKRLSQANSSTSHGKEGSGLGLYISKNIIESMRGHIGFDTELGRGTTFWFELPAVKNAKEESPSQPADLQQSSKSDLHGKPDVLPSTQNSIVLNGSHQSAIPTLPKAPAKAKPLVLHVENDNDFSTHLKTQLQMHADVIHAATSKEARKYLADKKFDLIILNVELPNNTGSKLLDEINTTRPAPPPVMILSAEEPTFELRQKAQKVMVKGRVSDELLLANIVLMLKKKA